MEIFLFFAGIAVCYLFVCLGIAAITWAERNKKMISTGSIYYDEIHRRANYDEWVEKLNRKEVTFEQWKNHWLATAMVWRDECLAANLELTAEHINVIIKRQK